MCALPDGPAKSSVGLGPRARSGEEAHRGKGRRGGILARMVRFTGTVASRRCLRAALRDEFDCQRALSYNSAHGSFKRRQTCPEPVK